MATGEVMAIGNNFEHGHDEGCLAPLSWALTR